MSSIITPDIVKNAYAVGYFPMADSKYGHIYWHSPDPRAIFPIEEIKPKKSILKKLRKGTFSFTINYNFYHVIRSCATREDTWISDDIINIYLTLYEQGFAHSVETWHEGEIVGGLYGVSIGGAFFGESMFNLISDSSKAAFHFLIERLKERKFEILDSQYLNPFTAQLGAIEIDREKYLKKLQKAIKLPVTFV